MLVTGATGSGKTTTLAAMLDHINRTRRQHIVTIEDPIEILHPDRGCIVNQREIGLDTASFEQALRRVLRQDPDVILIGELRDTETAHTALQAAESGHLVFSTLHTIDAAETLGRMIEFFPAAKQPQIRSILAGTLRGVVSQRLLPRADGGRVPAVEVMVTNARIQDLIRENRPDEITDAIAAGEFYEMQTFSQALIDLVLGGDVDRDVAANAATNRHDFLVALEQAEKRQRYEAEEAADESKPAAPAPLGAGLRTAWSTASGPSPERGETENRDHRSRRAPMGISSCSCPPAAPLGQRGDRDHRDRDGRRTGDHGALVEAALAGLLSSSLFSSPLHPPEVAGRADRERPDGVDPVALLRRHRRRQPAGHDRDDGAQVREPDQCPLRRQPRVAARAGRERQHSDRVRRRSRPDELLAVRELQAAHSHGTPGIRLEGPDADRLVPGTPIPGRRSADSTTESSCPPSRTSSKQTRC